MRRPPLPVLSGLGIGGNTLKLREIEQAGGHCFSDERLL